MSKSAQLSTIGVSLLVTGLSGCMTGPRHFRAIENPSAVYRARAATLGERLPDRKVIPKLLDHLADQDPMVRLTAHQELRKRTGQDFGFAPWTSQEDQDEAIKRWRQWWESTNSTNPKSSPEARTK